MSRAPATRPLQNITTARRWNTSSSSVHIDHSQPPPRPTATQLRNHFVKAAVPMIGFGLMDQTVMLQAGNAIDCTIGVTFSLSTLTAAAFGQVCSDAAGVLSGGALDRLFSRLGLPKTNFTAAQRSLPVVKRTALMGQLVGVVLGCLLGLVNLLFLDTERSSTLKLQALNEEQEFAFQVEASNAVREDATVLTVRGPDVDGLLASMTAALTSQGCSLVELHAAKAKAVATAPTGVTQVDDNINNSKDDKLDGKEISLTTTTSANTTNTTSSSISTNKLPLSSFLETNKEEDFIEDVFVVVHSKTKQQVEDDDLEDLAAALLEATFHPITVRSFKAQAQQLEEHNGELQHRIHKLEKLLQERQIKVVTTAGSGGSIGGIGRRSPVMATSSSSSTASSSSS